MAMLRKASSICANRLSVCSTISPIRCTKQVSFVKAASAWHRLPTPQHASSIQILSLNNYHTSFALERKKDIIAPSGPVIATEQKLVVLLDENGETIGEMGWHAANEIATKRELKMVEISNKSDPQQVFKLFTGKALMEEQKKQRSEKKTKYKISKMTLKTTITDHDMEVKTAQIMQWLGKEHDVKITVKNVSRDSKAISRVFSKITSAVKGTAKVVQSKTTEEEIIFNLQPNITERSDIANESLKPFTNEQLKEAQTLNKDNE